LASLDQRLSDMEQRSADRRHEAAQDATAEDERDYVAAKTQREAVTSMRLTNEQDRTRTRRDREETARERERKAGPSDRTHHETGQEAE
jgi:hypothetical protein